jgi:hypothetical protein
MNKMLKFTGGKMGTWQQMVYTPTGIIINGAEECQVTLGAVVVNGMAVTKTTKFTCSSLVLTMFTDKPVSSQVTFSRRPVAIHRPDWSDTDTAGTRYISNKPTKLSQFTNDITSTPALAVTALTSSTLVNSGKITTDGLSAVGSVAAGHVATDSINALTIVGDIIYTANITSGYYQLNGTKVIDNGRNGWFADAQVSGNLTSSTLANSGQISTNGIVATGTVKAFHVAGDSISTSDMTSLVTRTTNISSDQYNITGLTQPVIDSGGNGWFAHVEAVGNLNLPSGDYHHRGSIKMQCGNGGAGVNTSSVLGYQKFPVPFTYYTPHVVCTMNSPSLAVVFDIQVSNITPNGFYYNKRWQPNSGGGWGAATESFEWIAMIA